MENSANCDIVVSKILKKPFKDVGDMKGRVIGISLVFIVTLSLMVGGMYAKDMMVETREEMFRKANYADLEISISGGNESLVQRFEEVKGIERVESRLILDGFLTSPEYKSALFIGVKDPGLNTFSLKEGRDDIVGKDIVLAGKDPAFEVGSSIQAQISGNTGSFEVIGHVGSAEYSAVPPVPGSSIPMPGDKAVAYVDMATLRNFSSLSLNNLLIELDEHVDPRIIKDEILGIAGSSILLDISDREDEYTYQVFEAAIEEEEKVIPIMTIIFSMIGSVLIIVVMSKIILSQRKEIGVLMAMGYSRRRIMGSYLCFGSILGAICGILGGLMAIFVGYMWAGTGMEIFLDVDLVTKFSAMPFLISVVAGTFLVIFPVLISVYRINNLSAREAMRSGDSEEKIVRLNIDEHLSKLGKFSFRNLVRKPKRLIALIMALALTIGISGAWVIMIDSIVGQAELWKYQQNWDLQISFTSPMPDEKLDIFTGDFEDRITSYETYALGYGQSLGKDLKLLGITSSSKMIDFIITSGSLDYGNSGCLVTTNIAKQLDLSVGDEMMVKSGGREEPLEIKGIVTDLRENTVFLGKSKVQSLSGLPDYSTGLFLKTRQDSQQLKREMFGRKEISNVVSSDDFGVMMNTMVGEMKGLLYFFFFMNLSLLIVTVITVSLINVLERKSEYGLLEMLGYSKRDSEKTILQEITVLGVISTGLGLPTCYLFSLILRDIYSELMFFYPINISTGTLGLILGSVASFFLLSAISPIRAIQKMDIVECLRERSID